MAVLNRATFFFKDTNGFGWTETVHSLKPDLTSTLAAAVSLLNLRRDCLGTTARLEFVRVSDDLVKRDSMIYQVPAGDQSTRISAATASDIANTSLVVRLDATPLFRRTLYMRGIPDADVINSGRYAPDAVFQGAFATWLNELVTNAWAVRSRDNTVVTFTISAITQDPATGNVTFTTVGNHNFGANAAITIRNIGGIPRLNGNWSIFGVPGAQTFVIKTNFLIGQWAGGGSVAKVQYVLNPIVSGEVRRVSHRITGGPFDRPRGRKRALTRR